MMQLIGKVFALLFGLFWIVTGVAMLKDAKKQEALARTAAKWPKHSATVISADIVEWQERHKRRGRRAHMHTMAYPKIVYRYKVNGTVRTNETRKPNYISGTGHEYANELLGRYPAGATAEVRVNPANPLQTELEGTNRGEGGTKGQKLAWFPIGLGIIFCCIRIFSRIRR